MTTHDITNHDDTIDLRYVIERFEQLSDTEPLDDEDAAELAALKALLEECKGNGGDHKWQGDWYPVTLIRDSYFKDYAQELAEDIGAVKGGDWPNSYIDWDAAAEALQMDYTTVEFDGVTYWCR